MSLTKAFGQEKAARLFLQTLAGQRLAQAYIFLGPDGVGKFLFAREAAKLLFCERLEEATACGSCRACLRIDHDSHPDVHTVQPAEGKRVIHLDQVHELQHQMSLTPVEGGWRVCLLREADHMTEEAANSLLKTLEEPPGQSLLVLVASQLDALLPTIVSRCHLLRFQPLAPDDIGRILEQRSEAPAAEIRFAMHGADGSAGRAMSLLETGGLGKRQWLIERLSRFDDERPLDFSNELAQIAQAAGRTLEHRREAMRQMLDLMLFYYRDLLMVRLGVSGVPLYNADMHHQLERDASAIPEPVLLRLMIQVMATQRHINQNANLPLLLQNLAIGLADARVAT